MVDELMTYMKDTDGSLALDNLRRQARDNPMALALIGSGVAWLMLGSGGQTSAAADRFRSRSADYRADRDRPAYAAMPAGDLSGEYPGEYPADSALSDYEGSAQSDYDTGASSGAGAGLRDAAEGLSERAGALSDRARETAGDAADRLRATAGDAAERVRHLREDASHRASAAADDAREFADRGRRTVMEAVDREPLVLGAVGLAVGAAMGAMLPGTRFEDETFGGPRDSLVRTAGKTMDRAAEKARNVAGEAVRAAKTASEDEGLVIEGQAVADRVGNVAKAAVSAGKDAIEREAQATDNTAESERSGTAQPGVSEGADGSDGPTIRT
jgi:hypothetical protein